MNLEIRNPHYSSEIDYLNVILTDNEKADCILMEKGFIDSVSRYLAHLDYVYPDYDLLEQEYSIREVEIIRNRVEYMNSMVKELKTA